MPKISAVIITFNEEKNIGRCLDSLEGLVDEVVVVDSFSRDQTEAICRGKGARFFQHPFNGFVEQKNFAVSMTQNDLVLSLDADEALSSELKERIQKVKEQSSHQAYSFNRLTNYCGQWIKHSGWYPDKKVRLWDKNVGQWDGGGLHETVFLKSGVDVKHLEGDLLHYSFHTINEHIEQIHFFTDIGAQDSFNRGERTNLFKILGKPVWKFWRDYLFKAGFLDGYYGFIIAANSSYAKFLKQIKIRELQKGKFFDQEQKP